MNSVTFTYASLLWALVIAFYNSPCITQEEHSFSKDPQRGSKRDKRTS